MQKQRIVSQAVVQGEGNNDNYIRQRQMCIRDRRGTTPTTYYRWERELLSVASTAKALSETPAVAFAELPVPKQVCCNTTERSATLRIGNASLDIYPSCDTEQMKKLVELLRLC